MPRPKIQPHYSKSLGDILTRGYFEETKIPERAQQRNDKAYLDIMMLKLSGLRGEVITPELLPKKSDRDIVLLLWIEYDSASRKESKLRKGIGMRAIYAGRERLRSELDSVVWKFMNP
jgi:hypothetical protein